jgi:hypothetical protein
MTAATLRDMPDKSNWGERVNSWPMYANDQIGDCLIATFAHQTQAWTASDGVMVTPEERDVIAGYSRVGGYDPNNPSTDQGCVMLDGLNIWRREGLFGGRKIGMFAAIDKIVPNIVRAGVHLFGGLLLGVQLPVAADGRDEWLAPTNPQHCVGDWAVGGWGGHAVNVVAYDPQRLYCVTWGKIMPMSWNFFRLYVDECYVALSADWLGWDFKAPNGFDLPALMNDFNVITN